MSQSSSHQAITPSVSLALLVAIALTGTLSMHIFVPALPKAALDLHTDSQTVQMTITVYILGLAIGQLVYGPVADVIGRRKAILCAMVIYIFGAIASGLAPSAEFLSVARFVQALGGAGGLSLTRVIVADTYKGAQATERLAIMNLILLVGPGLAPVLGAIISELTGWRSIFAILTFTSLATLAISIGRLPETGNPTHQFRLARTFGGFRALFSNQSFMRVAIAGAFGSTATYGYIVSAPFILSGDMGLSVQMVGYCIGATIVAAAAGTLLTRSIVSRVGERVIQRAFSSLGLLTGLTFLVAALAHVLTPASVIGLSLMMLFCAGGLGPTTIGMAMRLAGPQAASAAGLYGCFQMLSGVICSYAAGVFPDHQVGCGLVLFCGYLICVVQLLRASR